MYRKIWCGEYEIVDYGGLNSFLNYDKRTNN
jgi:hypothetical protein